MVGDTSDKKAVVSSAYSFNETLSTQLKSLIKILKSMGPKSEPLGTPVIIDMKLEHTPVTLTHF